MNSPKFAMSVIPDSNRLCNLSLILPCCRTHRLRTDGEGWGGRGKNQEELTQGVMGGGSQLVGKTGSQRLQRWGSDSISM